MNMTISSVNPVRSEIAEMLDRIRDISTRTDAFNTSVKPSPVSETHTESAFQSILSGVKNAVMSVNTVQHATEQTKQAYIVGDPNVSLSQVVVASEKSKLALEGLMTVRNKILESYKEIMNMQV
jgi:flagellar hook-basal body complex protein FliE